MANAPIQPGSPRSSAVSSDPGRGLTGAEASIFDGIALRGRILLDEASLAKAAGDFGRIVHRRPLAVLEPGAVDDVVAIVELARRHRLRVAPRGQGHTTFAQAQVEGGIVVDMTSLNRIRSVDADSVFVDGGARWLDLVRYTIPRGLVPPTLTGYLGLSVGGTLSVGGIGAESFRKGVQADNVLELEVVTGAGELVRCSRDEHPELFDACRCGLGQLGVITGARLALDPAPPRVRSFSLTYAELAPFLAHQTRLATEGHFDHVSGMILPKEGGGWIYTLDVAKYLWDEGASETHDRAALSLPGAGPLLVTVAEKPFHAFAERTEAFADMMKAMGTWELPHPWFDVFLPASQARSFVGRVLADATPDDLGQGVVLTYPLKRSRCKAPFFRLPEEEDVVLFDWLCNASPPTPERIRGLLDTNARLYEESVALGAKLYPMGATPLRRADWQRHFHPVWGALEAAKKRFDPDGILTPGPGIF